MLLPDTELKFINKDIGFGVFATAFIPKGTILWVLDDFDIRLSIEQVMVLPELLKKRMERYGYINRHGQYILCWDFTRYFNHSCSPASRSVNEYFDIAVRDIHPGDQITCDYGILNYKDMECHCGSENCRKVIRAEDCEIYYKEWDKEIAEAWAVGNLVSQPLLPLLEQNQNNASLLKYFGSGNCEAIPSCRTYKFKKDMNEN